MPPSGKTAPQARSAWPTAGGRERRLVAVERGDVSASSLVQQELGAIEREYLRLNAFFWVDPRERWRRQRKPAPRARLRGAPGPLAGVSFGVKDLENVGGMPAMRDRCGALSRRWPRQDEPCQAEGGC